jgi:hypothetical protein
MTQIKRMTPRQHKENFTTLYLILFEHQNERLRVSYKVGTVF